MISVMPKGVEHLLFLVVLYGIDTGDDICDAEGVEHLTLETVSTLCFFLCYSLAVKHGIFRIYRIVGTG